jgi:hypothetical protein
MPTPFCFFPSFLQSPDDVALSVQSRGQRRDRPLLGVSGPQKGPSGMKHVRPFVGRKIERSVRVRLVHVVYGLCPQSSYNNSATRGCPHKLRQIIPRAGTSSKKSREA